MRSITIIALALLATLAMAGGALAGLNLEGQDGIFLNSTAYPVSKGEIEASCHSVNMDTLGSVTTASIAVGLPHKVELSYTSFGTSLEKTEDQNLFAVKAQFIEETSVIPAVSAWMIYRDANLGESSADYGLSLTKILTLAKRPLIVDFGARSTRAVNLGLFGFADDRKIKFEGSLAYLVTPKLALATEFKQQIDEPTWTDIAIRWMPSKSFNFDFGIANLDSDFDNQVAVAATWSKW